MQPTGHTRVGWPKECELIIRIRRPARAGLILEGPANVGGYSDQEEARVRRRVRTRLILEAPEKVGELSRNHPRSPSDVGGSFGS
jgi:hypothetical protein